MIALKDLPARISGYGSIKEIELIKVVMWWAHTYAGREWIDTEYLRVCYGQLGRAVPNGGFTSFLRSLAERKPPHVIKTRSGYKLEHRIADELTSAYGQREAAIRVDKLLTDLPVKLANPEEKAYLEETLICFRHKAFKAAVVMAWNVAYDHVCHWVLADSQRLAAFNAQLAKTYAKKNYPAISSRDSFEDPKESEVIQVLASASLINGAIHTVLKEKLDRRNKAAHPSGLIVTQPTAEDVISDLITNVVLKLQ